MKARLDLLVVIFIEFVFYIYIYIFFLHPCAPQVQEHLLLYARIKGVSEDLLAGVVGEKMKQMDLEPFRNTKVSGGRVSLQRRYGTAAVGLGLGLHILRRLFLC